MHALAPNLADQVVLDLTREWHFGHQPQPETAGNLYSPPPGHGRTRGHRPQRTTLPRMLLWGAGRLLRRLGGRRTHRTDLRPHARP